MDINILKDQLFQLINGSELPIYDLELNDIQNEITIITKDGKHFLLSLEEIKEL